MELDDLGLLPGTIRPRPVIIAESQNRTGGPPVALRQTLFFPET